MRKENSGIARRKIWIALCAVVIAVGGYFLTRTVIDVVRYRNMQRAVEIATYYPGVTVDERDLSGMTHDEAVALFRAEEEATARGMTLHFEADDLQMAVDAGDMGFHTDYEAVLQAAYRHGRAGTLEARYDVVEKTAREGAAYRITRGYDEALLRGAIDALAAQWSTPAVDAGVKGFDKGTARFSFTPEQSGRSVDAQAVYAASAEALSHGAGARVHVERKVVRPAVTKARLEKEYGLVASAVTSAASSQENRLNNIRIALKAIDGRHVNPGESFSFNAATGERTTKKGYKPAGAIVAGVMVEEPGGGVCQVSTTLFNAVAKAGLTIKERSPHSRVVGYVDIGKDAMVDWPYMDFRFVNETRGPVYLVAALDGEKRVSVSVYGPKIANGGRVTITSKKTGTTPPASDRFIPDGALETGETRLIEAAREGMSAVAYRNHLDSNGKTTKSEVLCYSTYPPAGNVYLIGP